MYRLRDVEYHKQSFSMPTIQFKNSQSKNEKNSEFEKMNQTLKAVQNIKKYILY
jgi:hypothetical protein